MRDQLTVRVEHIARDEPERAPGVLDEGTRRDAARAERPEDVHLHLHGRVVMYAQPIAASAIAAKIPPCTVPIGFPCAAVASRLDERLTGCERHEPCSRERGPGRRWDLSPPQRLHSLQHLRIV